MRATPAGGRTLQSVGESRCANIQALKATDWQPIGLCQQKVPRMPLTQLEAELRLIARARIASGQLPCEAVAQMWGGHGTGEPCALCDKPIQGDEIEFEVEERVEGSVQTLRFHMVCQSVWQLECARDDYLKKHP